jgi:hypothetical protein
MADRCNVIGCTKPVHGKGMCSRHYTRWIRHGDPLAGATDKGATGKFLNEVVPNHQSDDCLIWPFARNHGYAVLRRSGRTLIVSRLVCEAANGPPPTPEHEAAHSCGKGHLGCVNEKHLRWATHAENMSEGVDHGTSPRGERQGNAKLTRDDVVEIRALKGSLSQQAIAEKFGVTRGAIRGIYRGTNWAWLEC